MYKYQLKQLIQGLSAVVYICIFVYNVYLSPR